MRVVEVPAYFLPTVGGIETFVYYLSKEFIRHSHEVKVITSNINSDKSEENIEDIEVKRCKAFRFLKTPVSFSLYNCLKKEKCDVMHLHYPHPFFLEVGAFAARRKKVPYVVSVYGKDIELGGFMKLVSKLYNFIFLNYALKHAAAIITNTKKVIPQSRYLQKYRNKIVTIPLGVDVDEFKRVDTDLRERLGLANNKIIFYAGALRWYKGLDYLIKAMVKIKEAVPNVKLIIVGEGEEEKDIKKLVTSLGLEDYVIFKNFVQKSELLEYYSIADLFVLPSPTIEESFGLVALEALSMKVDTIVTEGAGVSEIFAGEGIGHVVKPRDSDSIAIKAIEVLKNDELRKKNAEAARNTLEKKFSWENVCKRFVKLFEESS